MIKCILEDSVRLSEELIKDGFEVVRDANQLTVYTEDKDVLSRIEKEAVVFTLKDETLAEVVVALLKEKGLKLAVSESLTGGLLSAEIVNVSGSSAVFKEGIVSYSNESKNARLGVDKDLLSLGAVARDVAYQMCRGLQAEDVDYTISTTGIAGPNGDGICNVIGKTFIGVGNRREITVGEYVFEGDRREVRRRAVLRALITLYQMITK